MDNRDYTDLNAELRELRGEIRKQSGELLDLRMSAGDLKTEMKSLRLRFEAIRDLPFSLDEHAGLSELIRHYLEIVLRITETEAASVVLVEETAPGRQAASLSRPALVFHSCGGPGAENLKAWHTSGGDGIAAWVAKYGVPYFVDDVDKDPRWSPDIGGRLGPTTGDIMCVPMTTAGRVVGVMELMNSEGATYSRDDLELMRFIASHASVMVENHRMLADYDAKVRHLSTLMELSNLLNSSLRQDEVRLRAIAAATRLMDAEAGSLLLVDDKTGELYFEVAIGGDDTNSRIKEVRLGMGEGIAGWVVKEAVPVIVNDAQNDPRFSRRADEKTGFVTRNLLCVPVITRGRVIGVLQAINRKGGQDFKETDMVSFENLANQVAIAIENSRLYDSLRTTFMDTSEALAEAIEKRDPYTGGHTRRVLGYCAVIARRLGMKPEEVETVELAAVLHDVGKIGVSDHILCKNAPLDDEEFQAMKMHPELGADIMEHIAALADIIPGIKSHHERLDGNGYPVGLSGADIPMMARIISVADSFDAMTTSRPYRQGLSTAYALSELRRCSGSQFDPAVVDAFIQAFEAGEIRLDEVHPGGGV
jgi:HD-GYP domain-containing protein (c-di-GMP phosphodiesterase class II)